MHACDCMIVTCDCMTLLQSCCINITSTINKSIKYASPNITTKLKFYKLLITCTKSTDTGYCADNHNTYIAAAKFITYSLLGLV